LFFDRILNEEVYRLPSAFPTSKTQNIVIWLKVGTEWPMFALMVNKIPDLLPQGGSQCFPFYTYDEDGNNRRENITDWALAQFRQQYGGQELGVGGRSLTQPPITKWDIFHYVYALLHHPTYRTTYAANLRRELPRIPFAEDFWGFAQAGARLAELHVNYEQQPEYPLKFIETPGEPLNWRVEKMRLSKDKSQIKYNEFLILAGIPPEVFEYKLGNRSALDWVIDQYQVSTDARSGIVNDPNNLEDEQYIVRLIGQVITVSLETVEIVKGLPELKVE
jgi:predicted helicase